MARLAKVVASKKKPKFPVRQKKIAVKFVADQELF